MEQNQFGNQLENVWHSTIKSCTVEFYHRWNDNKTIANCLKIWLGLSGLHLFLGYWHALPSQCAWLKLSLALPVDNQTHTPTPVDTLAFLISYF